MLSVEGLDLHYGASQALWRVSLTAAPGEITCLLGRNGVGKTSTLRAVCGQVAPSAGRITWEGADITRLPPAERARRGIALVPQGREIFPLLTVEENLRTGFAALPRAARRVPAEVLELIPVLGSMRQRRGGDLSGGQQQQLAIARALVGEPKVLLLDEPTEGIQPNIIQQIGSVLHRLVETKNMTVVLVEQYLDFVKEFGRSFYIMNRGRVVSQGDTKELSDAVVSQHLGV